MGNKTVQVYRYQYREFFIFSCGIGTGIGKIWYRKKVSELASEKFGTGKVSEPVSVKFGIGKKSQNWYRKIWYRKSTGIGI